MIRVEREVNGKVEVTHLTDAKSPVEWDGKKLVIKGVPDLDVKRDETSQGRDIIIGDTVFSS